MRVINKGMTTKTTAIIKAFIGTAAVLALIGLVIWGITLIVQYEKEGLLIGILVLSYFVISIFKIFYKYFKS